MPPPEARLATVRDAVVQQTGHIDTYVIGTISHHDLVE